MKMFLTPNEKNLLFPEMVLTEEIRKDYTKFKNFLMVVVYNVMFLKGILRVFPEIKMSLHSSTENRVGD